MAERGRPTEAERRLRDAFGVLERRRRYAGAARAAATLRYLLRERGERSRAESTLERAHVLYDFAVSTGGGPISTVEESGSSPLTRRVYPDDQEDYVHAQVLLTAKTQTTDAHSEDPPTVGGIATFSDATLALIRAETNTDRLQDLCACLKTIADASGVAVCAQKAVSSCLVTVGSVPRSVGDRMRNAGGVGQGVSVRDCGGSAQAVVPIRSGDQDEALASLVVHWSRPKVVATCPGVDHLLGLAAVLCALRFGWRLIDK